MMYNNLIYFLVVIFVFASTSVPRAPWLTPFLGVPLFSLMLFIYYQLAGRLFSRVRTGHASEYFKVEKKLSIQAVLLFVGAVFVFDIKYYFHPLAFNGTLPVLEDLAGLLLFFAILSLMWLQAKDVYQRLFHRSYTPFGFVFSNFKANLPIVLPWLILSFFFDLLQALPFPGLQKMLLSSWGDFLVFLVFIVIVTLFFPPVVRRLWNCQPLEQGDKRSEIEKFCRSQDFSSEIYYWPLFEGQVLTAGIMGIIPRFRYLLVTRALLAMLDKDELESVVAHEIGHVKNLHISLYALLFLGFSVLAGSATEPLTVFFTGRDWFYQLLSLLEVSPEGLIAFLSAVSMLVVMVLYFRFLFGYFIRNFERQADLYVFKAQGTSQPLIRSFEKIASMGGDIRDKKNWHHFGIGERIDYLDKCERHRYIVRNHDYKVYASLVLYFVCVVLSVLALHQGKTEEIARESGARYGRAVLEYRLKKQPENSRGFQLLGQLFLENRLEQKAIEAYTRAFDLSPDDAQLANNLAWLLLTARKKSLRDPVRALQLAQKAVGINGQEGFILDTLATAKWANGFVDEAIVIEREAALHDPSHREYYNQQAKRFRLQSWQ